MKIRLFTVGGSHPCDTVERALKIKGLSYSVVEFPPPMHMGAMKLLFGARTVPGIKIDGEKISGSRAILARLDELAPDPPLFPADGAARAAVIEAEVWGDEVLQPLVRRVLWPSFKAHPEVMANYSAGSKLPPVPVPVLKLIAPGVTTIEMRANHATDETYADDVRTLPILLDKIDGWIADGVMGGEQFNAADLQISSSLRLLMTFADFSEIFAGRPCADLALRCFPDAPGFAPVGTIPPELLPSVA
ncbi:MAG: glutathione S-transferase N-terminal domain-containing protein [Solirubrobacterales bacterium]|nr:glutathione S-transferase N-terminal domain-containing protein [Solirubrobacterales bacterium]